MSETRDSGVDAAAQAPGPGQVAGSPPAGPETADPSHKMPPIPVALEHVIGMAAASPAFAEVLRRDREAALGAAGLEMTPSERAILAAVPEALLSQMVSRMDGKLDVPDRRRFLELGALALATLLGGATAAGCSKKEPSSTSRSQTSDPPLPDEPGTPEPVRDPPEGARETPPPSAATPPDAGAARPAEEPPQRPAAEAGPERPAVEAGPERPAEGSPSRPAGADPVQPRPRPMSSPSIDGIRPRPRPQQPDPTRGVRPDYDPELPKTRGISPRGGRRSGTPSPDDI